MIDQFAQTDHFRLDEDRKADAVVLKSVSMTRRGPTEHHVCQLSRDQWRRVGERAINVLITQSGSEDEDKIHESNGKTYFGLMPGREIAVLFWTLIEDRDLDSQETILLSWRELAREERWWLYRKCSMPGQTEGRGWRRALLYALADRAEKTKSRAGEEKQSDLSPTLDNSTGQMELF